MTNQTVTVTFGSIIIGACWVAGIALAITNAFIGPDLGALSVAFLIAGGVLTVCRALERHDRNWTSAYEAGKEVGVRRIRNQV